VLPAILEAKGKLPLRHLRIWSAGCSTGEEPYTLNMLLMEEAASRLKNWTFEILATDLNERSLAHCKNGVYGDYSTRNLTPYYRQKYFDSSDNQLRVTSRLRGGITSKALAALVGLSDLLCRMGGIGHGFSEMRQVNFLEEPASPS
jgi:chemotaxis protein methyltransferase CheR